MNLWFHQALVCVREAADYEDRECTSVELYYFLLNSFVHFYRLIARLQEYVTISPSALDKFWIDIDRALAADIPGVKRVLSDVNEIRLAHQVTEIGRILCAYWASRPYGNLTESIIMEVQKSADWAAAGAIPAAYRYDREPFDGFLAGLQKPVEDDASENVA